MVLYRRDQPPARTQTLHPGGLIQIGPTACAGWLTGDVTREPHGRKPRAIAISSAPNRWCYTAVITHLLELKRCVDFLAKLNPSASEKCPEVRASVGIVRAPSGVPDHHFTMPLVTL